MRCYTPRWVSPNDVVIAVPCGKCLPCLVTKRDDWSFRLMQEYKRSQSAAFITLTYSPKFCPDDGLSKRHFQLFMKRLRKKSGQKLRYYAVGEYGTQTQRPHYHAIIFNYEGDEKFLQSIWSSARTGEPFGLVHIGQVNEASIRYTTKYIIQRPENMPKGFNPPFALMSRRYGIGARYLTDEMVAWHRGTSDPIKMTAEKARVYAMVYDQKVRLPRYYKDKIWPLVKDLPIWDYDRWNRVRKSISEKLLQQVKASEEANLYVLKQAGYSDPTEIIAEMRNAVVSRIREKVAFTQTL